MTETTWSDGPGGAGMYWAEVADTGVIEPVAVSDLPAGSAVHRLYVYCSAGPGLAVISPSAGRWRRWRPVDTPPAAGKPLDVKADAITGSNYDDPEPLRRVRAFLDGAGVMGSRNPKLLADTATLLAEQLLQLTEAQRAEQMERLSKSDAQLFVYTTNVLTNYAALATLSAPKAVQAQGVQAQAQRVQAQRVQAQQVLAQLTTQEARWREYYRNNAERLASATPAHMRCEATNLAYGLDNLPAAWCEQELRDLKVRNPTLHALVLEALQRRRHAQAAIDSSRAPSAASTAQPEVKQPEVKQPEVKQPVADARRQAWVVTASARHYDGSESVSMESPGAAAAPQEDFFDGILAALHELGQPHCTEQLATCLSAVGLTPSDLAPLSQHVADWGALSPAKIRAVATALASLVLDSDAPAANTVLQTLKRRNPLLHALVCCVIDHRAASVPPARRNTIAAPPGEFERLVGEIASLPLFERAERILRLRAVDRELATSVVRRLYGAPDRDSR